MTIPPTIPTGPIETAPRGFVPAAEQREQLLAVLAAAGVELGGYDWRIVDWLTVLPGYDWSSVATIASWVKRAAAGRDQAVEHRDHWHASYLSAGARVDELERERHSRASAPNPADDESLPPHLREALAVMGKRGRVVELTTTEPPMPGIDTCQQCRAEFDETDTRWDGRGRYQASPFCRRCVNRCHESTEFDHQCRVCEHMGA